MVNYELGKIYKLVCNKTGLTYIGSTCQKLLSQRLSGHVRNYNSWKNGKCNYITSFKIIEGGDYYMELLEAVPCSSFDELAKKERHYVESVNCVNKYIPGRTKQEWSKQYREDNREVISIKSKEYRENNKDVIAARRTEHYRHNKENIKVQESVKVKCSKCESVVIKRCLKKHQQTIKCKMLQANI